MHMRIAHENSVYLQGMYGWRLHQAVQRYDAYALGDPPPEPEAFQVRQALMYACVHSRVYIIALCYCLTCLPSSV